MAGVAGLEPTKCQSQSLVPYRLGYTPILVEESGFEPLKAKLTDLQSVPFGQLGYSSINGDPERTRTVDLQRDRLAF